jgi:glycosyltransferase involved in cell wall biosynthesis
VNKRRRLLLIQPGLNPPGGAQCVAAWALQALREEYRVDLLTWLPVDFEGVNRFYGTSLVAREIKQTYAPAWLRRLVALDPDPYTFQPCAFLMRAAKLRRTSYDLLVSFCDEMEFGAPALQYVHWSWTYPIYRKGKYLESLPGLQGRIRAGMYKNRPWRIISGFSFSRLMKNFWLVNSHWTGEAIRQGFRIQPVVLYPPVPGDFPAVPWNERENGFVCIGRISSEKNYEEIIAILSQIRARGHAIHLHIVGQISGQSEASIYFQRLMELIRANSEWVLFEENVSRSELAQLVTRHRYGIHGRRGEHFGIAVAEMVRGGCVVFVPNSGGQVEIVGEEERLRYDSIEEGVGKISRVLDDAAVQRDLQDKLDERAGLFSPECFANRLRELVGQYLIAKGGS